MTQVINHIFHIEDGEYECKIERWPTGFMKSECYVTIFAPTDPPRNNFQEMFIEEKMIESGGIWKFERTLPKRVIDLEEKLTTVINNLSY